MVKTKFNYVRTLDQFEKLKLIRNPLGNYEFTHQTNQPIITTAREIIESFHKHSGSTTAIMEEIKVPYRTLLDTIDLYLRLNIGKQVKDDDTPFVSEDEYVASPEIFGNKYTDLIIFE